MREIVLDTETTGLDFANDRVIEIGAVEIKDLLPTGKTFHVYLDPGSRNVHPEAFKVHGISNEFLSGKPRFRKISKEMLTFFGDAPLVAHNASFDITMLNTELKRIGLPELSNPIVDTLALARSKKPGGRHTLDAMCAFYRIDASRRTKHGALLDADILSEVYIELCGGRQQTFDLAVDIVDDEPDKPVIPQRSLPPRTTESELQAHRQFLSEQVTSPIWQRFFAS